VKKIKRQTAIVKAGKGIITAYLGMETVSKFFKKQGFGQRKCVFNSGIFVWIPKP